MNSRRKSSSRVEPGVTGLRVSFAHGWREVEGVAVSARPVTPMRRPYGRAAIRMTVVDVAAAVRVEVEALRAILPRGAVLLGAQDLRRYSQPGYRAGSIVLRDLGQSIEAAEKALNGRADVDELLARGGHVRLCDPSGASRTRGVRFEAPALLAVLGLDEDATLEEVRRAHKALAKRFHPDVPGGDAKKMSEINGAVARLESLLAVPVS